MARGYIRKRGDRRYQIVYDAPRGADGKRRQKYKTISGTKRQAQAQLTEILQTLNRGDYAEPTRLTLAEYLDLWLADYAEVNVRPRTLRGYEAIVKRLKDALGNIRLSELEPYQIQNYYAKKMREGLSAYTVIHQHRLLRQALKHAVQWRMLPFNPTDGVKPPSRSIKPAFRVLDASEVQRLLHEAEPTDYHLAIHLAIYTGLRRSEILGLRWGDVDLAGSTLAVQRTMVNFTGDPAHIGVPKTQRSRRTVSFSAQTGLLMRAYRERRQAQLEYHDDTLTDDSQVCIRPNGHIVKPAALGLGYARIAKKAGIDVRFHDLRHTHATMMLTAGVPVHIVQARLGHESIQTTIDIYGHVLPISDAEASQKLESELDVGRMWAETPQSEVR